MKKVKDLSYPSNYNFLFYEGSHFMISVVEKD